MPNDDDDLSALADMSSDRSMPSVCQSENRFALRRLERGRAGRGRDRARAQLRHASTRRAGPVVRMTVGEDDELLAAVEIDGEELAAEVLAQ